MTLELVKRLEDSRQETMEAWANNEYVGTTGEKTLLSNAMALGGMDLLAKVLEIFYDHRRASLEIVQKGAHHDKNSY